MNELLSTGEMGAADRATIAAGKPGFILMQNAGKAVFEAAADMFGEGGAALVVCGPGNNGGDGFIAASLLEQAGQEVSVTLLGDPERLGGDARLAFQKWGGKLTPPHSLDPARFALIIDALLGAGLDRPVSGEFAEMIGRINRSGAPVLSVDLPSGVRGDTGQAMGAAIRASRTVTFFHRKPGHLLMPGRHYCGEVTLADIGISEDVLQGLGVRCFENGPQSWGAMLPRPEPGGHKYDRGHALAVSGGPTRTGAIRLAARAALRVGAGLVTIASPPPALMVHAMHATAVMLAGMEGAKGLASLLEDPRFSALVLGPALGVGEATRELAGVALDAGRACVLDADALTSFADAPQALFDRIEAGGGPTVLTPHAGEFARLFGAPQGEGDGGPQEEDEDEQMRELRHEAGPGKLEAARAAAHASGAVVVYKGADTVIAAPDGRAAINANAPASLATAGAGDVLAGMICGLLAQGMPAFEAASAAVWLHGAAAGRFGPGLIAEDIETQLPAVLRELG